MKLLVYLKTVSKIKLTLRFKKKNKISFELLNNLMSKRKFTNFTVYGGLKTFMGKKFMGKIRSTFFIKNGIVIKIWTNVRVKDHAKLVSFKICMIRPEVSGLNNKLFNLLSSTLLLQLQLYLFQVFQLLY